MWKNKLNSFALILAIIFIVLYGVPVMVSMILGWPTDSIAAKGSGIAVLGFIVAFAYGYNKYIAQRNKN